jgi:hypothetical protein
MAHDHQKLLSDIIEKLESGKFGSLRTHNNIPALKNDISVDVKHTSSKTRRYTITHNEETLRVYVDVLNYPSTRSPPPQYGNTDPGSLVIKEDGIFFKGPGWKVPKKLLPTAMKMADSSSDFNPKALVDYEEQRSARKNKVDTRSRQKGQLVRLRFLLQNLLEHSSKEETDKILLLLRIKSVHEDRT